jgi:hypothetical protein
MEFNNNSKIYYYQNIILSNIKIYIIIITIKWVTTEAKTTGDATSRAESQKLLGILWNPKVH